VCVCGGHVHYAVSCMQTAVIILSADLEVLVVNIHILLHIHRAFVSSQVSREVF